MKKVLVLLAVLALTFSHAQEEVTVTSRIKLTMSIAWSTSSNDALEMVLTPTEEERISASRTNYSDGETVVKAESDIGTIVVFIKEIPETEDLKVTLAIFEDIDDEEPKVFGKFVDSEVLEDDGKKFVRMLFETRDLYYAITLTR